MEFAAGDRVAVRGDQWIVDEATAFGDCSVLSLSTADALGKRSSCKLLFPFDKPVKRAGVSTVRAVTGRRWMRHLHVMLSERRMFGQLRSAVYASIDILPFQLEPALALVGGYATRLLLADEVGLGKTIQAGLMLAELKEHGWCGHALIVTPFGLRRQWADELQRRFDIRVTIVDAAALAMLTRSLPREVNPWSVEPVCVTSIDFIKQPEVLEGLRGQLWDILIVDEAHQASAASLRYEALKTIADRSRHVVLLTATPHAGDEAAYRALCDLGKLDPSDRILLFRRTRQQLRLSRTRRVHLLAVRLSPQALAMHRRLAAYVERLWHIAQHTGRHDVQLVAMVLSKRAYSSAFSLASSVQRRLAALEGSEPAPSQSALPFDEADAGDEPPSPIAAAFDRTDEEASALRQILDAAVDVGEHGEPKILALRRLLRRVAEPIVVFTEYRDTLEALESTLSGLRKITTLHGGQTADERRNSVEAFNTGAADLLLATDAGAEGINLQHRCRLIVNLELPWNPIRLEQRIGRVDRIGQTKTVHAINLFAADTAESGVLAALARRIECIRLSEIEVAASMISRAPLPIRSADPSVGGYATTVDLESSATNEAARIGKRRDSQRLRSRLQDGVIPVTALRSNILRTQGHKEIPSVIWLLRVRIGNRAGRLVEDRLVAVASSMNPVRRRLRRQEVRGTAERMLYELGPSVIEVASRLGRRRAIEIARVAEEGIVRAQRRERQLAATEAASVAGLVQPGLFDSRALKRQRLAEERHHSILEECTERSASLEADTTLILVHQPEIASMLITC